MKAGGQHNETLLCDAAKGVDVSEIKPGEFSDKDLEQVAGGITIGGSRGEDSLTFRILQVNYSEFSPD